MCITINFSYIFADNIQVSWMSTGIIKVIVTEIINSGWDRRWISQVFFMDDLEIKLGLWFQFTFQYSF